ncbi:MAG: hypothetical protein A2045_08610 [Rhodocyclales bacterium GWA2_65_20]|nr:MAG: hypothetical protein A2045_08610 [Rhodocyclales bacterium GWA2_65_20]
MSTRGDTAVMIVCGLALLAAMTVAQAQALADPTRPPALVADPAGGPGATAAPAGLQSIIRRDGAKPAALINGEYVTLGGRVGDATVVKIGEDSVTLKSATGLETLKLMPDAEKTPVVAPENKSGNRKARKKNAGAGVSK